MTEPDKIAHGNEQGRGRRLSDAVIALVVVGAVVAGVVLTRARSETPSPRRADNGSSAVAGAPQEDDSVTRVTCTPGARGRPMTEPGWNSVPAHSGLGVPSIPGRAYDMTTVAIAASPTRYVAVGNKGPYPIWFSLDGWRWTRALVMDGPQPRLLTDVTWTGLQFVAVGRDVRHRAAIWFSPDGHHWVHNVLPLAGARPAGVVMTTHGLLVWGTKRYARGWDGGWVMHLDRGCLGQDDGHAVPLTRLPGVRRRSVVLVMERQNRILVAYGLQEGRPRAWTSIDGSTWREWSGNHVPPALRCCAEPGRHKVANGPSGWLVLDHGPTGVVRLKSAPV